MGTGRRAGRFAQISGYAVAQCPGVLDAVGDRDAAAEIPSEVEPGVPGFESIERSRELLIARSVLGDGSRPANDLDFVWRGQNAQQIFQFLPHHVYEVAIRQRCVFRLPNTSHKSRKGRASLRRTSGEKGGVPDGAQYLALLALWNKEAETVQGPATRMVFVAAENHGHGRVVDLFEGVSDGKVEGELQVCVGMGGDGEGKGTGMELLCRIPGVQLEQIAPRFWMHGLQIPSGMNGIAEPFLQGVDQGLQAIPKGK